MPPAVKNFDENNLCCKITGQCSVSAYSASSPPQAERHAGASQLQATAVGDHQESFEQEDGRKPQSSAQKRGADAETSASSGVSPAKQQRLAVSELRNRHLQSALMLAVFQGRADAADKLVQLDMTQVHRHYDRWGRNVLHYCAVAEPEVAARMVSRFLRLRQEGGLTPQLERGLRAALTMPDSRWRTPIQTAAEADALGSVRVLEVLAAELREPRGGFIDAAEVARAGAWRVARWLRETGRASTPLVSTARGDCAGWGYRAGVADDAADASGPGSADWGQGAAMSGSEVLELCASPGDNCPKEARPALSLVPLMTCGDPAGIVRRLLGAADWRLAVGSRNFSRIEK